MSQSPQTGQVYFNPIIWADEYSGVLQSQSPQTGQVYFNNIYSFFLCSLYFFSVSIPSNGSSLFQLEKVENWDIYETFGLNPLKRVKFISISGQLVNL